MRDNGAIEGAADGFAEDDEVIIMLHMTEADEKIHKVIGHSDGVKPCLFYIVEVRLDPIRYWAIKGDNYREITDDDEKERIAEYGYHLVDGVWLDYLGIDWKDTIEITDPITNETTTRPITYNDKLVTNSMEWVEGSDWNTPPPDIDVMPQYKRDLLDGWDAYIYSTVTPQEKDPIINVLLNESTHVGGWSDETYEENHIKEETNFLIENGASVISRDTSGGRIDTPHSTYRPTDRTYYRYEESLDSRHITRVIVEHYPYDYVQTDEEHIFSYKLVGDIDYSTITHTDIYVGDDKIFGNVTNWTQKSVSTTIQNLHTTSGAPYGGYTKSNLMDIDGSIVASAISSALMYGRHTLSPAGGGSESDIWHVEYEDIIGNWEIICGERNIHNVSEYYTPYWWKGSGDDEFVCLYYHHTYAYHAASTDPYIENGNTKWNWTSESTSSVWQSWAAFKVQASEEVIHVLIGEGQWYSFGWDFNTHYVVLLHKWTDPTYQYGLLFVNKETGNYELLENIGTGDWGIPLYVRGAGKDVYKEPEPEPEL